MDIIFKCIAGSRMFGVHNQFSDYDYKSIYLLPKSQRKNPPPKANSVTIISPEEGGEERFHFEAFLKLLIEGQTIPVEMLYCPQDCIVSSSPLWERIVAHRNKLIHKNIASFYGMAFNQAMNYSEKGNRIQAFLGLKTFLESKPPMSRMREMEGEVLNFIKNAPYTSHKGHKLIRYKEYQTKMGLEKMLQVCETNLGFNHKIKDQIKILENELSVYGARSLEAFKNDAMDYKSLSHCVRVALEAKELLMDHKLTLPLKEADRKLVLSIKEGKLPKQDILDLVNKHLAEIDTYVEKSSLRDHADTKFINDLLEEYRKGKL